MREIDMTKGIDRLTMMAYGDSGSGKTQFIGTCPRPIVLADATEGGWLTIQNMGKEKWWEPTVAPRVIAIEKSADLFPAIDKINDEVRLHPGRIRTVAVDSLTFIGDLYLAALERDAMEELKSGKKVDARQTYGRLLTRLREMMIRVHSIPHVHIVWTALAKEPDEPGRDGGILLAGQYRGKAPAACSLWAYLKSEMDGDNLKFYMHCSRYGVFPARGRFSDRLPSVMAPTFAAIDKALELKTPRERQMSVQVPRVPAKTAVAHKA